jgi:hypothetical protein
VGDIHSCFIELSELLRKLEFSSEDLLLSAGDLINRGPYPMQTLNFFRNTPNAYFVKGNHEWRMTEVLMGREKPRWSESLTLVQLPENQHKTWAIFFAQAPAIIETQDLILAHAKLSPIRDLSDQLVEEVGAIGKFKKSPKRDLQNLPLWFRSRLAQFADERAICIGHEYFPKVEMWPNRLYALDTKVDKGGYLTAVIFPGAQIVQVKSLKNYHLASKYAFYKQDLDTCPERVPFDMLLYYLQQTSDNRIWTALEKRFSIQKMLSKYENLHWEWVSGIRSTNAELELIFSWLIRYKDQTFTPQNLKGYVGSHHTLESFSEMLAKGLTGT